APKGSSSLHFPRAYEPCGARRRCNGCPGPSGAPEGVSDALNVLTEQRRSASARKRLRAELGCEVSECVDRHRFWLSCSPVLRLSGSAAVTSGFTRWLWVRGRPWTQDAAFICMLRLLRPYTVSRAGRMRRKCVQTRPASKVLAFLAS